jgi:hypothetical protein
MHVEIVGRGPRLVLVHGSVTPGWVTWNGQKPLASRFTLVVPTRTGYPPNPPLERLDFEEQARELLDMLDPGDHLVAHSYGVEQVTSCYLLVRRSGVPARPPRDA